MYILFEMTIFWRLLRGQIEILDCATIHEYKNIEQIWSFTLDEGVWKVSNIEVYASLDGYLKQAAHLPKIENTLNQVP